MGVRPANTIILSSQVKRENCSGGKNTKSTGDTYLVKCRNFASMLRCRMHILVRAEPMSLVAPEKDNMKSKQTIIYGITAWHYKSQAWPSTIRFSETRHNTSGEGSERSNSLLSGRFIESIFPSKKVFPSAATRGTKGEDKRRTHKCHICLEKANVTVVELNFAPIPSLLAFPSKMCVHYSHLSIKTACGNLLLYFSSLLKCN